MRIHVSKRSAAKWSNASRSRDFVTASQNPPDGRRSGQRTTCRTVDVWINPFSSQYLSDVVPEIFSPHTTIPVSLSTPSSLPSYVKDLSEGDLFLGGE